MNKYECLRGLKYCRDINHSSYIIGLYDLFSCVNLCLVVHECNLMITDWYFSGFSDRCKIRNWERTGSTSVDGSSYWRTTR